MQAQLANDIFKATTLIRITAVAWFFAKIMSWKLWLADRVFPVAAPLDFLNSAPSQVHLYLLILSLGGLFGVVLYPQNKIVAACLLVVELLSCSLDQLRWQPWEYQYMLTLCFFLLYKSDKDFIKALSLLLVATYFFSGLFKINGGFLHNIWDNMMLRKLFGFKNEIIGNPIVHFSGLILPVIEIATALGLLFARQKKTFVWLALATHIFLLLAIGPSGLQRNSIVWPWNFAMILLIFAVFYKEQNTILTLNFFKNKTNVAISLIVAVLPLTNYIGLWPSYFSFKLYSGNSKILAIRVENTDRDPKLDKLIVNTNSIYCPALKSINATKLSLDELNVPVYPEELYFKKLKSAWIQKFPETRSHFIIFQYPSKLENTKEIR